MVEVASAMGIQEGAVKVHKSRGRANIRKALVAVYDISDIRSLLGS